MTILRRKMIRELELRRNPYPPAQLRHASLGSRSRSTHDPGTAGTPQYRYDGQISACDSETPENNSQPIGLAASTAIGRKTAVRRHAGCRVSSSGAGAASSVRTGRHLLQPRRAVLRVVLCETLVAFEQNNLGGKVGFTMVLHTWDQQLRPHFHVHCVIAAGALADDGTRWIEADKKFMFPVRALSKVFRAKYLESLQELLEEDQLDVPNYLAELKTPQHEHRWLRKLRRKAWVVYSKAPFAGPQKLFDYLGRYTHRVAISNHRLVACENGQVRFAYRDRRDGDRRKTTALPVQTFIGRFLIHVLPPGFMRIRHYGFLSNRAKKSCLAQCRQQLHAAKPERSEEKTVADWMLELMGIDITSCPHCGAPLETEPLPSRPQCWRDSPTCFDTS